MGTLILRDSKVFSLHAELYRNPSLTNLKQAITGFTLYPQWSVRTAHGFSKKKIYYCDLGIRSLNELPPPPNTTYLVKSVLGIWLYVSQTSYRINWVIMRRDDCKIEISIISRYR